MNNTVLTVVAVPVLGAAFAAHAQTTECWRVGSEIQCRTTPDPRQMSPDPRINPPLSPLGPVWQPPKTTTCYPVGSTLRCETR
jgi:hypothetical protein